VVQGALDLFQTTLEAAEGGGASRVQFPAFIVPLLTSDLDINVLGKNSFEHWVLLLTSKITNLVSFQRGFKKTSHPNRC
jgi:hypothetical protein